MSFGKTQGDSPDKSIAVMLQDDAADARLCNQEWEGMRQNAPIISGSMKALRLPAFFETLGNSNVILTADSGSFGHKDGPASGAIACRQVEEAWKAWRSGQYGNVSLSDGVVEFAKTHEEIKGAFLTFPKDADEIYPGWKEKLGCTAEASVPPASLCECKDLYSLLSRSSHGAHHYECREDGLAKHSRISGQPVHRWTQKYPPCQQQQQHGTNHAGNRKRVA